MDEIGNTIVKSINKLKPWFESSEMAMIIINGGYELVVGDKKINHL